MTVHPKVTAAAFLSTALISLAPNILLFLFPNYGALGGDDGGRAVLSSGQALAVGGLIGDVFLHTLPDCFADALGDNHHDHDHHDHDHHDHDNDDHDDNHHGHHHHGGEIGLLVILGFTIFLILDIIVRSFEVKTGGDEKEKGVKGKGTTSENDEKHCWQRCLSSAALLNMLGDSMHNFTDGLAIGASFSVTQVSDPNATLFSLLRSRGGLASISVFLHEVPHELGDFATLVRAGFTRNMAIGAQFVTALSAFLGTWFGLFSGQIIQGLGHDVLLPFTAGGFLYLACATILPDVLETDVNVGIRVLQVSSFLLGVAFMYGVAYLEEMESSSIEHEHEHEHMHSEL